jgi:hypothetical protein
LPKKQWYFLPEIEYRPKSFVPGAEEYMEAWMVRIAPDETIGKMKNLVHTIKAKEKI